MQRISKQRISKQYISVMCPTSPYGQKDSDCESIATPAGPNMYTLIISKQYISKQHISKVERVLYMKEYIKQASRNGGGWGGGIAEETIECSVVAA